MGRAWRTPLIVCAVLAGCGVSKETKGPVQQYAMHGVVQSIDSASHAATIKHDTIKGFMGAMTMEYPIRDPKEFSKLKPGETIDATVFAQDTDYWVGNIRPAGK